MPALWPFPAYEKIAESLDRFLGDDEPAYRAVARVDWIVTEKIHGANLCFVTDGIEIRVAKRKAFLDPDEDFFGHRAVLERKSKNLLHLASLVREAHPAAARIFIYGELFGGAYPHPDVAPDPAVLPIQTGCFYCPGIEHCAFDLAILQGDESERTYLDYDEATALLERADIFHARPLFRGAYEDAIAYPLGFDSHIPALLGLPPLPPGTNKAEGVVIKPVRPISIPRRAGTIRPVIKRKIPEFAEDARYHEAQKWAERPAPQHFAPALDILKYELSALVTEPRLNAAVSKIGRIVPGDTDRLTELLALIIDDLRTELAAREGARLRALSPADAAELSRFIEAEARALVELYLPA